jgi:hypothetical protein
MGTGLNYVLYDSISIRADGFCRGDICYKPFSLTESKKKPVRRIERSEAKQGLHTRYLGVYVSEVLLKHHQLPNSTRHELHAEEDLMTLRGQIMVDLCG